MLCCGYYCYFLADECPQRKAGVGDYFCFYHCIYILAEYPSSSKAKLISVCDAELYKFLMTTLYVI